MNPIPPKALRSDQRFVVIAKDQDDYTPLPAGMSPDGEMMIEFEFSAEDLAAILAGGRLRLWAMTFNHKCDACGRLHFNPIKMEITE
jgi:hypothetical protein